jgi:uncharacterized membrane protein
MDEQIRQLAQQLLDSGIGKLSVRERQVNCTGYEPTYCLPHVNQAFEERRSVGGRLADQVAAFGGSWTFIILALIALLTWVLLNSALFTLGRSSFDPYPFIFLNLILSMLAALQAPIIMMSQNRQTAGDRLAAGFDYEINLKAELEIMGLHKKMEDMQVEHIGGLLRLGQEQCRLLRLLADGRMNSCASEASGTLR